MFPIQSFIAFSKKSGFIDHIGSCTVTSCATLIPTYLYVSDHLLRLYELMGVRIGNCHIIVTYQIPWLYSVNTDVNPYSGADRNYIAYTDHFSSSACLWQSHFPTFVSGMMRTISSRDKQNPQALESHDYWLHCFSNKTKIHGCPEFQRRFKW